MTIDLSADRLTNGLSHEQYRQLIAPIKPIRVLQDPRGNSHVSQQDVTAHLIRVFGFCNFDTELLSLDLVFEEPRRTTNSETNVPNPVTHSTRWDVCYRASFRLTIKDHAGYVLATYEDASCGDAQNQNRQDAHDLAMKSAISTAKKRCAINLGDQFGLSLYNKGQMTALVRGSLVAPPQDDDEQSADVQDGVEQQVSLGHDETEPPNPEANAEQVEALRRVLGATEIDEASK